MITHLDSEYLISYSAVGWDGFILYFVSHLWHPTSRRILLVDDREKPRDLRDLLELCFCTSCTSRKINNLSLKIGPCTNSS